MKMQHPSPESLTAYFDRELPPQDIPSIDRHLSDCPECRALLEAFTVMSGMGPVVEESLPGAAYWEDLPDRILVRIAGEAATPPPVRESWWSRLQPRRVSWQWGLGGLATAAAGVAVVLAVTGGPDRAASPETLFASQSPDPRNTASLLDQLASVDAKPDPSLTPDTFAQRVIVTLGGDDTGTSLDLVPGEQVGSGGAASGVGQQVSLSLPGDLPVSPDPMAGADGNCDRSSVVRAFEIAAQAEELGRPDLAAMGYALVRANVSPDDPLHAKSHYALNRLAWHFRMQQVAGIERARMMEKLNRQAKLRYQKWQESQGLQDCREAWCLNRVWMNLSAGVAPDPEVDQTEARVMNLEDCLKR
jgi:hypothetical protein